MTTKEYLESQGIFSLETKKIYNEINEWMNAYAFHKIEAIWDELLKERETTGFNPEMDKIFEKHLKELE